MGVLNKFLSKGRSVWHVDRIGTCSACCFCNSVLGRRHSRIHAHTRVVLQYLFLVRSSSNSSSKFTAKANSYFVVFASWLHLCPGLNAVTNFTIFRNS